MDALTMHKRKSLSCGRLTWLPDYIDDYAARHGCFGGDGDDGDDDGGPGEVDDAGNATGPGADVGGPGAGGEGLGGGDPEGAGYDGFGGFGTPAGDDPEGAGYSGFAASGGFGPPDTGGGLFGKGIETIGKGMIGMGFKAALGPFGLLAAPFVGLIDKYTDPLSPEEQALADADKAAIANQQGGYVAPTFDPPQPRPARGPTPLQQALQDQSRTALTSRYRGGPNAFSGDLYDVATGQGLTPIQAALLNSQRGR